MALLKDFLFSLLLWWLWSNFHREWSEFMKTKNIWCKSNSAFNFSKVVVLHDLFPPTSHAPAQYYTFTLAQRKSQQGSVGEGRCGAGPGAYLPLHCYLLLLHKETPWRAASRRKARQRMSQLELRREEDQCLSSMTTLSSMNTIYATGSLFSNRPPLFRLLCPALSPHSQGPFLSSVFCLILFSHSFSFLQAKSREMLPKHCKLIKALNIYYMTAGGLHGRDAWEECAVERNVGSSSGSSLRSHTLSVTQGMMTAYSSQRSQKKTWTYNGDNWLIMFH